jgi:hypothetical protein
MPAFVLGRLWKARTKLDTNTTATIAMSSTTIAIVNNHHHQQCPTSCIGRRHLPVAFHPDLMQKKCQFFERAAPAGSQPGLENDKFRENECLHQQNKIQKLCIIGRAGLAMMTRGSRNNQEMQEKTKFW